MKSYRKKISFFLFTLLGVSLIFGLVRAEEETAPPTEIDATTGWNGGLAFNSINNTWLIVSQHHTGKAILGRIIDNEGKILGNEIVIDQEPTYFTGAPKVAFAPDKNKFLVVWAQESNTAGSAADIYGRFLAPDGAFLGNAFNITPNDPRVPVFSPNSAMHYDSVNKKFVFAFENRSPGIAVYMKTIGIDGTIGPALMVAEKPGDFLGAPSLAVNEKDNEYCISYQNSAAGHWEPGKDNVSRLAIKRVDAGTNEVGSEYILSDDLFFNNSIVHNSMENKYFITWTDSKIDKTLSRTLDKCSGDKSVEPDALGDKIVASITAYNPKSNTYGLIAMDCCNVNNVYMIFDTSLNILDQGNVFLDSRKSDPSKGGNYIPVIAVNTNNGTYGITSSVDYVTTRFMSNLGSTMLIGKTYGGNGPNFAEVPQPIIPTQGLPTDLGQLIQQIFSWSLSILGIAVFVMIFYAGFLWLTAAGNTAKIGEARGHITNAVLGAILLLSSYLILYTINPDFVKNTVNLPGLGAIK